MRFSTCLAMVSLMMTGGVALAQPADAPVRVAPDATVAAPASRDVTSTGSVIPEPETGTAAPRVDPNRTGPDVVNGLEVPRMKDPREGGRE
jgi:hypothetical protein